MSRIAPPAKSASSTTRLFKRKESESRQLSSERIAEDLARFREEGGRIEVLGVTQVLKKLDGTAEPGAAPARPVDGSRRGRR